jgi:predicted short-subunit dehydrogenase-like oxidoreductase (DUF2520 family)
MKPPLGTTVSIIGAGRLGTALGAALKHRGFTIQGISCGSVLSVRASHRFIGAGIPFTDIHKAAAGSRIVFLTVPDDAIVEVAKELAASVRSWSGVFVFHCSGLHLSAILKPLARKGARTASLHPIQSFASKRAAPDVFRSIYFGIEGEPQALETACSLVRDLGGNPLVLAAEHKPLYHAACSMASNLLVALIHEASGLLPSAGIPHPIGSDILLPLIQGTLQNVKIFDTGKALTGPLTRGDGETIKHHLKALQDHPSALLVYREMSKSALSIAHTEEKISSRKYRQLMALLADK